MQKSAKLSLADTAVYNFYMKACNDLYSKNLPIFEYHFNNEIYKISLSNFYKYYLQGYAVSIESSIFSYFNKTDFDNMNKNTKDDNVAVLFYYVAILENIINGNNIMCYEPKLYRNPNHDEPLPIISNNATELLNYQYLFKGIKKYIIIHTTNNCIFKYDVKNLVKINDFMKIILKKIFDFTIYDLSQLLNTCHQNLALIYSNHCKKLPKIGEDSTVSGGKKRHLKTRKSKA